MQACRTLNKVIHEPLSWCQIALLTMSDRDACALRPDGTLKDASEIEWLHSPTSNHFPLPPADTLHDKIAQEINEDEFEPLPPPAARFKGKEPARRVGGRRVPKPSDKVVASSGQDLSPRTKIFFFSRFEGILSILFDLLLLITS
jgi:hypothetical protein